MVTFLSQWVERRLATSLRKRGLSVLDRVEFERQLLRERHRAARHGRPICRLMVELLGGSVPLRRCFRVGRLLVRHLRRTDLIGRIEPGCFAVVLPETDLVGGQVVRERMRRLMQDVGIDAKISLEIVESDRWHDHDDRDPPRWGSLSVEHAPRGALDHRDDRVTTEEGGSGAVAVVRMDRAQAVMQRGLAVTVVPMHRTRHRAFLGDAVKRAIDIAVASLALVAVAPLLFLAAVAIRLTSRGPAIYRQQREGLHARSFYVYKLRTMVIDAESTQHLYRDQNLRDGPAFKLVRDPRVTAVGRVLRATCLDELPQLWNVVKGDMSLVGPRPLPLQESRACRPWQRRRLDVRPGISCYWQVDKRRAPTFDDWMRLDLRYVDNANLGTDLMLMARACLVAVRGHGNR